MVFAMLMLGATLLASTIPAASTRTLESYNKTGMNLRRIDTALKSYAIGNNLNIPCPAPTTTSDGAASASCTGVQNSGVLPWKDLELSVDDVKDGWGHLFTYIVDPAAATTSICNGTAAKTTGTLSHDAESDVPGGNYLFAIIGHGPNGRGAGTFNSNGTRQISPPLAGQEEYKNCPHNPSGSGCVRTAALTSYRAGSAVRSSNPADVFDDVVSEYGSNLDTFCQKNNSPTPNSNYAFDLSNTDGTNTSISNSTRGGAIPHIQIVEADTGGALTPGTKTQASINFGSLSTPVPGTAAVPTLGSSRQASCIWTKDAIPFETQRLSTTITAQMGQGETNIDEAQGTADGFVIIVVPGASVTSATFCGADSGEGMAYDDTGNGGGYGTLPAGEGINPLGNANLKFGIEFDNWSYNGDDPYLNHVAVLRHNDANHSSRISTPATSYTAAPGCPNRDSFSTSPAVNGTANWGCTWRLNQAAWMETRMSTTSSAPAYSATSPAAFTSRIDIVRECNAGCSQCSNGSGNFMKIKVWAACPDTASCKDITVVKDNILNTPLAIDQNEITNFHFLQTSKQSGNNAAGLRLQMTGGANADFAALGFQVGDYVRLTSTSPSLNTEFTIAEINHERLTLPYGQDVLINKNYDNFTMTRLTNTISACVLEPTASSTGFNASSSFKTVKVGLGVSNGLNSSLRVSDWKVQSYND
ncbi:MAG: hypothetical protein K2Q10_04870, partial [Rhodospirillales bacterium]|nr:hypothetical protein [Rhodospirillales bacterium]